MHKTQKKNHSLKYQSISAYCQWDGSFSPSLCLSPKTLSRILLSNLHIQLKKQLLNLAIAFIPTIINFRIALSSNPAGAAECY